jgi:hypothetical protein
VASTPEAPEWHTGASAPMTLSTLVFYFALLAVSEYWPRRRLLSTPEIGIVAGVLGLVATCFVHRMLARRWNRKVYGVPRPIGVRWDPSLFDVLLYLIVCLLFAFMSVQMTR